VRDYAGVLNRAHVPVRTQQEQKRQKNLKINLLWQTPALLLLAALFIGMGVEHALLTPLHLFQGRDAVEIAIVEPLLFWGGAVFFPLWLMALWIDALSRPAGETMRWWDKFECFSVNFALKLGAVMLAGYLLLLPAQFLFMPWLGYQRCSCLTFDRSAGTSLPVPAPIRWVKPKNAQVADDCKRRLKFCRLL